MRHGTDEQSVQSCRLRRTMDAQEVDSYDHLFKLLLVGDAGVGKSSMLLRFTEDTFDDHLQSTIGVDFKVKMMQVDGKRIKMTIWDTAGQERFRTLTSSYYRGAQGVILVYDVARKETFENLGTWLQEVEVYSPSNGRDVVKLLVGNKIDKERVVSRQEGEAWARSKGMLFVESSAKTKIGIQQVFNEVVQKILDNPALLANTAPRSRAKKVNLSADKYSANANAGGGCC
ncbi:rab family, other [Saprolegnia diclina VS20]|uniref:small monomeric GTPase n=1 Tax=Saprolegnia diclina (strain VS20) TaxID=1156394 RepID=T0QE48_SAPDV|nr:rab family, other [Saprolegnia diclina VS20]EQC36174.1 rab family, other [Saprolegnia diclina VS20]|eukprot:XP_008610280.1 rab family, other [Saprolegnia diclina VS20]